MHIGSLLGETVATCFFLWGFVKLMAKPLDFSCDATETAKQDLCDATQIDLCWLISFRISFLLASFENGWMDFLRFDRSMITEDELVNAFKIFDKDFLASSHHCHRERAPRIWFNGVQCARTKVAPSMPLSSRMCFASWAFLWIPCSHSVELSWNFKPQIWSQ